MIRLSVDITDRVTGDGRHICKVYVHKSHVVRDIQFNLEDDQIFPKTPGQKGVGVVRDIQLNLEDDQVSHTIGGLVM